MADLGNLSISLKNLSFKSNITSYLSYFVFERVLEFNLTTLNFDIDNFGVEFDGLNDFLYLLNGIINKIAGSFLRKIKSDISDEFKTYLPWINTGINFLFQYYIPDTYDIAGTNLTLDFAFASPLISREGIDLQLPLSIKIDSS